MRLRKRVAALIAAGCLTCAAPVVKHFEGKENEAYLDIVNVATACYGYTKNVRLGTTYTDAECNELLDVELREKLEGLVGCVDADVDLEPHQWAAMVSWSYNVGTHAACSSTLVRKVNAGASPQEWCPELKRWVYAGGKKVRGLARRREAEYQLCLGQ